MTAAEWAHALFVLATLPASPRPPCPPQPAR